MKKFMLTIMKLFTITMIVSSFSVGLLYSQSNPSREILVYITSGIQRPTSNTALQITSTKIKSSLSHFNINENSISSAFPNFNEKDTLKKNLYGRIIKLPNMARIFKIEVPIGASREEIIDSLKKNPEVLFAEKNGTASPQVVPNDQYFTYQWALQSGGGTGKIEAPEAWDIYTGTSQNTIGIIDWGVDGTHPDLTGKTTGDAPTDDYHGTHVAGIAGAKTNNSKGVAGVDWNAQLLSEKIENLDDSGIYQKIVNAVNYNSSVCVLNNSWQLNNSDYSPRYSTTVGMAFAYAYKMDRVSVCANGNFQQTFPGQTYYPAGYGQGIIAVGATDNNDVIANFSQVNNGIDISAPGVSILSTYRNGIYFSDPNYEYLTGTSMATPFVSGTASLLKGYNPNLYNDDIEHIIELSADKVRQDLYTYNSNGWNINIGYGRLNVYKALSYLKAPYALDQLSTSGGTDYYKGPLSGLEIIGAPGLSDGYYYVYRHEVRMNVNFSYRTNPNVWGRGVASTGWSLENPNYAMGFCDAVPGSVTNTSATLYTYVYEVYNLGGQWIGWYPTSPQNTVFAYTVLGIVPPLSASISGPTSLGYGQNGTWNASVSGGYPPYNYQWYYEYPGGGGTQPSKVINPNLPAPGTWYTVGTNSATLTTAFYSSIYLKCVVTDSHNIVATSNIMTVTIGGAKIEAYQPVEPAVALLKFYAMDQNYPNPFNPTTIINYQLPKDGFVSLKVYDVVGNVVRTLVDEYKSAGIYSANFDGSNLASGMYFYRLETNGYVSIKKMILLK